MLDLDIQTHPERRALLIALLVIALASGGLWLEHHIAAVETWIQGMGHWAGIGFVVLFAIATPLFFSVDALCVLAGAIFSLPAAIAYVLIATMLAAALIFHIGRRLAKEKIQTLLKKHPKLLIIDQLIEDGGFKILFLLRLLPLPFALLSYAFSVSRTKFLDYWLATTGIFFYNVTITYFGYLAAHLSKQLSQASEYTGPPNTLLVGGVIVGILILFLITHLAKAEISKMQTSGDKPF